MKKTVTHTVDSLEPLGFWEDGKKLSMFCRVRSDPHAIFLLSNAKQSLVHFSANSAKRVIIAHAVTPKFSLAHVNNIVSARVGAKEVIVFTYGSGPTAKLMIAEHKRGHEWWVRGAATGIHERGGIVSDGSIRNERVMYFGESLIWTASAKNALDWTKRKDPVLKPRPGFFDHGDMKFLGAEHCEKGTIILYDASVRDGDQVKLQVGAALISPSDPQKVIWRADHPIFEKTVPYHADLRSVGAVFADDTALIYWYSEHGGIQSCSLFTPFSKSPVRKASRLVKRSAKNPIIAPQKGRWWGSEATLNPAAVNIGGVIHLLFRAMGPDGVSRIGYARTTDGIHIDEIHPEPVFALEYSAYGLRPVTERKFDPVRYPSGGSWGGCEDPRVTKIGDRVYLTFNAFDNWDNIRIGMVSISVDDFLAKRWNWAPMRFLSPVGRHKNWVLFPEKINGRYAMFHNLHSKETDRVMVEYFDSMELAGITDPNFHSPDPLKMPNRPIAWHIRMKAPGPSPVKTDEGWLLLYQAHDAEMGKYKVGALLLDLDDPTRVIARSSVPILEPTEWYENEWKPGIVYSCGAVEKDGTLFIYYGGGDKHVCVATAPMKEFLDALKRDRPIVPIISKVVIA
ncbi:MAG: hypothetical protein KGH93_02215 [Patescibacteria group bacterium]|nr:hypothetical protein [Patescibacteria group bacterium]MDE1945992.1 hypothetical protein [Patescibacteria group bacterium]